VKVLVIGGAGFIGSQLALYLSETGHQVYVMDNLVRRGSESNVPVLRKHGIPFYHGDVRNAEDFIDIPSPEVVCLTAAQPSAVAGYNNPTLDIHSNTIGVLNTLEFARDTASGVIFWSTNKVYSADNVNQFPMRDMGTRHEWYQDFNPSIESGFSPRYGFSELLGVDGGQHSIYGLSKAMADLMCQEYYHAFGVPTIVNRFSCVSGPGQFGKEEQGWFVWFAIAHRYGLPVTLTGWNGKQVRDILFIDDLCRLINIQINHITDISGEVFNIGGGRENTTSLLEHLRQLRLIYGRGVYTTFESEPRKADHCIYISDIRKADRLLGWRPQITMEQGYEQIVDWVSKNDALLGSLYDKG
jgi:CDP-paratose 2-epimerase